jgi:[acyl-carrier-protein] S-malonyltransferase
MRKFGILFPGQGSQYVGMGKKLYDAFDEVRALFEAADKASGVALTDLCFNGPEEELRKTYNTQPAILLASCAVWMVLKKQTGLQPFMFAGHSLGEYSALCASGLFSLEEAVRLVRTRGLLMEEACPAGLGGMVALIGPVLDKVESVCSEISHDDYVAGPANLNSPDQLVLSGNAEALKEAIEKLKGTGYRKAVPLSVSGPFHSPLMKPAAEKLKVAFSTVTFREMTCPVVSNVDARPYNDPARAKDLLYQQMFSPVRWEACVRTMAGQGVETFLEVGPQKVLTNMIKKIVPDIPCYHVEEMEEIEAVRSLFA